MNGRRSRAVATVLALAATLLPTWPATPPVAAETPGGNTGRSMLRGIDACAAPSIAAMRAFYDESPYADWGIYLGGSARACAQPNLTASWVSQANEIGWSFFPIWVGPQAPCSVFRSKFSADPATARGQGMAEADKAIAAATALGFSTGSVIYYDLEGHDGSCRSAAKAFIDGWTSQLQTVRGWKAAVYGSACATYLADFGTIGNVPHGIWFARWDGALTPNTDSCIPDTLWPNRRIKQYRGSHNETWNGFTINVDNNCANGIVAPHAHGSVNCPAAVELDFGAYPTLGSGSTGSTVRALQFLLDKRGFGAGAADGVFGTRTESAVRAFRQRVGLPDSGVADRPLWTALLSAGDDPTVQSGATGAAVKRLQRSLTAALGRALAIDGDFGPGTEQAVRDYQSSRGQTVDGVAGPATWNALQQGR